MLQYLRDAKGVAYTRRLRRSPSRRSSALRWWPQRDSNPRLGLESADSSAPLEPVAVLCVMPNA